MSVLGQPTCHRPVGHPKYRWKGEVAKDLKELNVPKWSKLSKDRKKETTSISTAGSSVSKVSTCRLWVRSLFYVVCGFILFFHVIFFVT